jgi:hypothetical protein
MKNTKEPDGRAIGLIGLLRPSLSNPADVRISLILSMILGLLGALWGPAALAQSHKIYVEPQWLYNSGNFPTPIRTTLAASWADVQAEAFCSGQNCTTYICRFSPKALSYRRSAPGRRPSAPDVGRNYARCSRRNQGVE